MIDRTVEVERMEHVISVFGSFDQNLRLIESDLNVKILDRDNLIHITGEEEGVMLAEKAINGLLALAARGEAIDAVLEKENADYEAQRGVINEQTQRLFRDIFVSEVLRKLYEDDQRLTQLSVRVNRMLKDRFFGSSRYSFGLKPVAVLSFW